MGVGTFFSNVHTLYIPFTAIQPSSKHQASREMAGQGFQNDPFFILSFFMINDAAGSIWQIVNTDVSKNFLQMSIQNYDGGC